MNLTINKSSVGAFVCFVSVSLALGCSPKQQEAQPPPAQEHKPAANAVQQHQMSSSRGPQVQPQVYDFASKKDPFKPAGTVTPITMNVPPVVAGVGLPIQNYESNQFKVIGIIAGLKENRAMIVDPVGKGYVVKPGMIIGRNAGRIVKITPTAVEVIELQREQTGKLTKQLIKLTLPKKD